MIPAANRPEPDPGVRAPDYVTFPISEMMRGDRRLEAEAYMSDGFIIRGQIRRSNLQVFSLGESAKIWRPSASRMKAIQVGPEHGVPFISATQVFDIWPAPRKWIAPSKTPHLADRYLTPGWILVTCSGTVGNVMIAYSAQADLVVSDDLLRVEIDEPKLRNYVYVFLRSRFGRAMMRSSQYGSVIKHLDIGDLAKTPVPFLGHLLDALSAEVAESFVMRDEAYGLDTMSRSRLADALPDRPETSPEEGYVTPTSQLFRGRRRLDASAHSPGSRFVSIVYERKRRFYCGVGRDRARPRSQVRLQAYLW